MEPAAINKKKLTGHAYSNTQQLREDFVPCKMPNTAHVSDVTDVATNY